MAEVEKNSEKKDKKQVAPIIQDNKERVKRKLRKRGDPLRLDNTLTVTKNESPKPRVSVENKNVASGEVVDHKTESTDDAMPHFWSCPPWM